MKDLAAFGTKVWTITLVYNESKIVEQAINQYYATRWLTGSGFQHVFVDHHYPIDKKANSVRNRAICNHWGGTWLDPGKNLGLHDGFNWAMNQLPIQDHHFVIMYDGDNFPITPGWDDALTRVLYYDPTMAWTTLWQPAIRDHEHRRDLFNWHQKKVVDGISVWIADRPFVKTVAGWKAGFLKSIGGFKEPTKYWGHLESSMQHEVRQRGMWDCYLPDFYESSAPSHQIHPFYGHWKGEHAHVYRFTEDFEAYLRANGKQDLIGPD